MELLNIWMSLKKEYRYFICIILIVIIGILSGIFILYNHKKDNTKVIESETIVVSKTQAKKESIQVDIKGAIQKPGVYELMENSIVKDVIEKSGGLTENADTTYINLSKHLKDEMVIVIYTKDEIMAMKEGKENIVVVEGKCVCPNVKNDGCIDESNKVDNKKENKVDHNGMVNLNTATLEELKTLTGIGISKAKDIIAYREAHQGFQKIEEIMEVKGIGNATFQKIKDRLIVS